MKSLLNLLAFMAFVTSCAPALALTAVCKEPKGQILGVIPSLGDRSEINEADGMTGGLFTVVWDRGADHATFVTQGSGGGAPNNETGARVLQTDDHVSFVVVYEHTAWLYSLYPKLGRLLITSHGEGVLLDGAVIKAFQAKCDISE